MNLFENLQKLNEAENKQNSIQTLEDVAKQIENNFEEKFISTFGRENELYADMLYSATDNISDKYFSEGYDIVLTIQQSPQFNDDFKEFIKTFANEYKYDIEECSSSLIKVLIKVDEF